MRRDLGQMSLADGLVNQRAGRNGWLDRIDSIVDWPAVVKVLDGIYASDEGRPSYPLVTYVKLLLLQQWYGLSDPGLEEAVDDRLSFRRFAGLPLDEGVPDHSAIWRFRQELAKAGLAEAVFAEVGRQLDAQRLDRALRHADRRHLGGGGGQAAQGQRRRGLGARPGGRLDQEERQEPLRLQGAHRGRRGLGDHPRRRS